MSGAEALSSCLGAKALCGFFAFNREGEREAGEWGGSAGAGAVTAAHCCSLLSPGRGKRQKNQGSCSSFVSPIASLLRAHSIAKRSSHTQIADARGTQD